MTQLLITQETQDVQVILTKNAEIQGILTSLSGLTKKLDTEKEKRAGQMSTPDGEREAF